MAPIDAVPVVGTPLAYGLGLAVLIFVLVTDSWARSLVTVAHEGGHVAMAILTGRGHGGFSLADGGGGATRIVKGGWGVGWIFGLFAGYPTPPLLGLGGAALISHGHAWSALWSAVFLLLAAVVVADNQLARVFTTICFIGTGWVAVSGTPFHQAAVAVGLDWWLLIGGAYWAASGFIRARTSDAAELARATLIPGFVWDAVWSCLGAAILVKGGRYLLAV